MLNPSGFAFKDCWGNEVTLTSERLNHILEHPEMIGQASEVAQTLENPEQVVVSPTDERVRLFYRLYGGLAIGEKYLCVVVKYGEKGPFIITAYFTDRPKRGRELWRK